MHHSRFSTTAVLIFLLLLLLLSSSTSSTAHRRFLHQPLFPFDQPISQPPLTAPSPQQPKYPFSSLTPPDTTTQNPFFPFYPSSPPPPSPPSTNSAFATFPANISSLVLPSTSHPSHNPVKLISLVVSLFSLLLFISLLLLLLLRRRRHPGHRDLKTDSLRLFPPDTPTSDNTAPLDNSKKPPPPLHPIRTPTTTSSEFLYLGTLVSSREPPPSVQNDAKAPKITYHRLGSPELHPLPPLPRQHSGQIYQNAPPAAPPENHENEEEFLWSRESTAKNACASRTGLPPTALNDGVRANVLNKSRSLNSLNCNSPAYSVSPDNSPSVVPNTASPRSMQSKSPDSLVSFPGPLRRFIPPPPAREPRKVPLFSPFSPSSTEDGSTTRDCSPRPSDFSSIGKVPPTPPHPLNGPPELVAPSWKVLVQNVSAEKLSSGNAENESMENLKQKLTPLHLDKVRANSDRAMVWDQLNSTSLQLNEEMIETLFMVNANGNAREGVTPELNQENLVLDLKKSRNIDMLLRALNVTVDEVCEALVEGNADALGAELLECLLKMAPTKEEERRFRECKDESPFKLGTAEVFLKALLDVPFAFKRVDALVYVSNFESETERLKMSFHTLEWACNELKSSRLFRKLLEAVLKTGNRMSVGTNRGDAHAFKLDTLLKLVDVKDGDGKTTLLHFVVQEIIRTEGTRLDQNPNAKQNHPPTLGDEVHYRKLGLQVISGLSGELTNVKKAAAMDADVLSKDVAELAKGISKINEVLKLNGKLPSNEAKFSDCMNEFLKKAEMEIMNIQAQEGIAISMVKGLTEYFHGDLAKEEAHPFRLFVVVREFLLILDRVCKDVGKINERTVMNSGREISMAVAPSLPRFDEKARGSSSDDESSSSS